MIEIRNLTIGFGPRTLLDNLSMSFPDKSLTALIGRNGTGKSTFMKAICGINERYSGEILFDGENIKNISRHKLSTKIAYVNTLRPKIGNLKCIEIVALGRSPYTGWDGRLSGKDREIVGKAIKMVGMEDYRSRYFNSLSDGESQKIMIARAIAQDTQYILLDEPTSFLDLPTRYELVSILKKLTREENKTVIFSTHELDIALKLSDYIALVADSTVHLLPASEMSASPFLKSLLPPL